MSLSKPTPTTVAVASVVAVGSIALLSAALRRRVSSAPLPPAPFTPIPTHCARVRRLRELMHEEGVHALVVTSADAHQSEYVAHSDKRREFVSRFTGSAGTVLLTQERALLWTDGRYFVQAKQELGPDWTLMRTGIDPTLEQCLDHSTKPTPPTHPAVALIPGVFSGCVVGVEAALISASQGVAIANTLAANGSRLKALKRSLVDEVWRDHNPPAAALNPVVVLGDDVAGETVQAKVARVAKAMQDCSPPAASLIVSALDEVCWLLNLRGSDVDYNPVFKAYVVVANTPQGPDVALYTHAHRLPDSTRAHLDKHAVRVRDYTDVWMDVHALRVQAQPVWLDVQSSSWAMHRIVTSPPSPPVVHTHTSPIAHMKGEKNPVEQAGMRECHARDAVAVVELLWWLEQAKEDEDGHLASGAWFANCAQSPPGVLDEVSVADVLEHRRSLLPRFKGLSFPTICGVGSNGAIIHYHAEQPTCARFHRDKLVLIDSGAQYEDGTTDITRTFHLGKPTAHQQECFTRVLKGVIGLTTSVFPDGVGGFQLDFLARASLWQAGLDYRHGTGHGVGHFLNVHEGPHGISPRSAPMTMLPFKHGMVTSIEPGYYEDGSFGIRIENLAICTKKIERGFGDKDYLGFDTITLVPIQAKMMQPSLLSAEEVTWVDEYHAKCRDALLPRLQGQPEVLKWVQRNTAPLHEQWKELGAL